MITKYYVLAHYSRHIRKGMQILLSQHSDTVIAYDHLKHRLVIVCLNRNNRMDIGFDFSIFSRISDGSVKRWTTNTLNGSLYIETNDLYIKAKKLTLLLEEKTVQTFEIDNVFI